VPEVVSTQTLQDILDSDRKYRERRHAEWTDNYLLFRSRVITNRLTQRQSINVPYVKETIRAQVARTATPPDVYFEDKSSDKQRELLMNEYWLECARQNKITVLDHVDRKQEGLYGRSFIGLNIVNGRIVFTIYDPQDILLDRFMLPWDISTARHVTRVGIYRTLSELARNPAYDRQAIKNLEAFFGSKSGVIKASENAQIMADKAERLRQLGVPDVLDPQVGETYVEINETQIKVQDEKTGEEVVYVETTGNGSEKLGERRMKDVLGVNRLTICTWAGDVEATDIWSDGAADIARPMNQLANIRISQKAENGTLMNYGMQFYDSTGTENWTPAGYVPAPFAFFPFPGDPNTKLKRVDIPEMSDVFSEMDWYKSQIESATATTPVVKGETEEGDQTKYEVQALAAAANKRITSGAPLTEQYWQDIGELFADLVNANPHLLSPTKLYKKGPSGTVYPRVIDPAELVSPEGYQTKVTSKAKKDAEALETIQKLRIAKAEFPVNAPLQRITKKRIAAWLELSPEEEAEVIAYDDQMTAAGIIPPGGSPIPASKPAASPAAAPAMTNV
jgi:hypothetical protein